MKFQKNADEPISHLKEDRFGRINFAISLAESLVKVPNNQPFTTALYGSWGSGKTSIINMASEHISKKYESTIVIRFNPWLFGSPQTLHQAFFSTLAYKLGNNLKTKGEAVSEQLRRYGDVTGPATDIATLFFPPAKIIGKGLGVVTKVFGKSKPVDIEVLRDRLNKLLSKSGTRVVVIIDDIDRLDREEIHQIFKLVKNVAHFQNVSYLLAFDQDVVSKVISTHFPSDEKLGGNFIDKIVQLPLYVPGVDQIHLNNYLTEQLDIIIDQYRLDAPKEDISRFQSVYFVRDGQELFDTPRKVVRFLNTIDFSVERLGNEASFTDLVLIDILRNFFPELYKRIASNKELLLGQDSYGQRDDAKKDFARKVIFGEADPSVIEVTIVKELFPTFEWALGGAGYAGDFIRGWEDSRRVCTEKYFNRYFAYDIPIGDIADAKITSLISRLDLPKTTLVEAESQLKTLTREGDPAIIISKLRRQEKSLEETASLKLSQVLVKIGASLPRVEQSLAGDLLSPYVQSAVLTVKLTRNTSDAYSLLEKYLRESSINYSAELLRWVRTDADKKTDGSEDEVPFLKPEQVDSLGKLVADRIKDHSKSHYIQKDFPKDTAYLMWIWQKWGDNTDIREYFNKSFKSNAQRALDLIMSYTSSAWSLETGIKLPSDFRIEAYKEIAKYVDPDIFVKPLIKLFGKEVNEGDYESHRFSKNRDHGYVLAKQFLSIHREVTEENKTKSVEKTKIIEGEVIE